MPVQIFKDYFLEEYRKVDDDGGYFLECAYTDVILNDKLPSRNFHAIPESLVRAEAAV